MSKVSSIDPVGITKACISVVVPNNSRMIVIVHSAIMPRWGSGGGGASGPRSVSTTVVFPVSTEGPRNELITQFSGLLIGTCAFNPIQYRVVLPRASGPANAAAVRKTAPQHSLDRGVRRRLAQYQT